MSLASLVLASGSAPAQGAVVIRDDATGGDCRVAGTWARGTRTCRLTSDLTDAVFIESPGITLDCEGHRITRPDPSSTTGVDLDPLADGVTVKDCTLMEFSIGINSMGPSNVRIAGNTILGVEPFRSTNPDRSRYGVFIRFGSGHEIVGNSIDRYTFGMGVGSAQGALIETNDVGPFTGRAIEIATVDDSAIRDNSISIASGTGFLAGGLAIFGGTSLSVTRNSVTGGSNALFVVSNILDGKRSGEVEIAYNKLDNSTTGIALEGDSLTVSGNLVTNSRTGVRIGPHWEDLPNLDIEMTANVITGSALEGIAVELQPSQPYDYRIFGNNIYGNATIVGPQITVRNTLFQPSTDAELSFNGVGNFWGRSCALGAPFFVSEEDSNGRGVEDRFPYGIPVAGLKTLPPPPACLDPVSLLLALIETTMSLELQEGIENSLEMTMKTALRSLEDADDSDVVAVNALQAYINQVEALGRDRIPAEDAADLIARAQAIITLLGGG